MKKGSKKSIRILTVPNILSFYRFLILIPVIILFPDNSNTSKVIILCLFFSAIISDILDGILARKLNQISELGKILDPVIDKISIGIIGILLIIYRDLPVWVMIIVIFRDILIFSGGLYIKIKKRITLTSIFSGKITALFISLTGILYFLEFYKFAYPFLYLTLFLILYSLIVYFLKFLEALKQIVCDS